MSEKDNPVLETKDVRVNPEVANAFSEFMGAFEAFRETNDERLKEIETRMASDVVTRDKLERVSDALDEHRRRVDDLVLKAARPPIGAGGAASCHVAAEHKSAFAAYVRGGRETGLKEIEKKALTGSSDDAGFLVPDAIEREVGMRLAAISPIRSIASVVQISGGTYKKAFSSAGPEVGWAAEALDYSETAAPTLREMSFPTHELYAIPAASQTLLEDAAVDIDRWLATEIETAFAEKESAAFVSGDGTGKPAGFMAATKVADGSWQWERLGYVVTGQSGGFDASDGTAGVSSADALIDLVYALKSGYRQNATFVMSRKTQAAIRKLKDADGNLIWSPPATPGAPASLLNFPVVESEEMDEIGPDSFSVAFGDFKRGYMVVDRAGIRILRDPFTSKPHVLFYTTKRVGGGIQDYAAIKLLKFGTA